MSNQVLRGCRRILLLAEQNHSATSCSVVQNFINSQPNFTSHICATIDDVNQISNLSEVESAVILSSKNSVLLQHVVEKCSSIKWIHNWIVGVDKHREFITKELSQTNIALTNARGAFTAALVEYTIGACFHFIKKFPMLMQDTKDKIWNEHNMNQLYGRTMGFVGYGDLSQGVAKAAKFFRMKTIACRRNPSKGVDEYLDEVTYFNDNGMEKVFTESDFIVCTLPSTAETLNCIDMKLLSKMKSTGVFISIGRGTVVVEEHLAEVLKMQKIGGAALDVFQEEPLPSDSPLWGLPNLVITAHSADRVDDMSLLALRVYKENFEAFLKGAPESADFVTLVDKKSGY